MSTIIDNAGGFSGQSGWSEFWSRTVWAEYGRRHAALVELWAANHGLEQPLSQEDYGRAVVFAAVGCEDYLRTLTDLPKELAWAERVCGETLSEEHLAIVMSVPRFAAYHAYTVAQQ